jgi:probable O-glycosylation ligase (exosortase A-associated)
MDTIRTYETEGSAQLRFMSWSAAYRVAEDRPLTGGGFRVLHHRETYDHYLPEYPPQYAHDAHSIYFNLIGDHGWPGFVLFTTLIGSTFVSLRRLKKTAKARPDITWISGYASMIQISLIAWLLNGAFLSVAYFDLAYHLIIITAVLKALAAGAPENAPATPTGAGRVVRRVGPPRLRSA